MSNNTNKSQLNVFLCNTWKLLEPKPDLIISVAGTLKNQKNQKQCDKLVKEIIKVFYFLYGTYLCFIDSSL